MLDFVKFIVCQVDQVQQPINAQRTAGQPKNDKDLHQLYFTASVPFFSEMTVLFTYLNKQVQRQVKLVDRLCVC
jgi:hypothetical protein